jgi:hypothetical protein
MNLRGHLNDTVDFFAYVQAYLGHFPAEDRMTAGRAIGILKDSLIDALRATKSKIVEHWLTLSLGEITVAGENIGTDQIEHAKKHLRAAREFCEYAIQKKKMEATFIVGSDGKTKQICEASELPKRNGNISKADCSP